MIKSGYKDPSKNNRWKLSLAILNVATGRNINTQFGFLFYLLTFLLDRGNDNWLINYEKTPEVDRQVEGEEGVSIF